METVLELEASLNSKGKAHAAALIKAGDVSKSEDWSGPTSGAENRYLENHSWAEYGKWFLGVDKENDPETKAHYKYPFTDDFKTVSLNGLRAIRTRAAQSGESEIFNAAGPLFDAIKEKMGLSQLVEFRAKLHNIQEFRAVDLNNGTMSDVSILEEGEAKGHNVLITQSTLEGAAQVLQGKSLPAYITHDNAQGDRLTSEVGYFSGFYLDQGNKVLSLRARTFRAFSSFKKYQPEVYERLFEMAETLPENFGVSLVFEARLFWDLNDGSQADFEGWDAAPEGATYELPTVEVKRVMSADFVDNPAANSSLFSVIKNGNKTMNTEFTTAASDELERKKIEAGEQPKAPVAEEPSEPKKKKRKKLSIPVEVIEEADDSLNDVSNIEETPEAEMSAESDQVADLEARLSERDELIKGMQKNLNELQTEIQALRDMVSGEEPLPEDAADEVISEEQNINALKEQAVKDILEMNKNMSRSCALLEVGKKHPEYFNN